MLLQRIAAFGPHFFYIFDKFTAMDHPGHFRLGKILKIAGSKGEVLAFLDVDNPLQYRNLEMVFLAIDNHLIPFFIDSIQFKANNQVVIKFQDIDTIEETNIIIGSELHLPTRRSAKPAGEKFILRQVIGFEVFDKEKGYVGTVKNIMEHSHQSIFEIDLNGKEILVPAADELIRKIDSKNKRIYIEAPEGLIDMYLE